MNVCKICNKEYDQIKLEQSVGATHWTYKFCSASCYTKDMNIQNTKQ
jgi:hypothetical protein